MKLGYWKRGEHFTKTHALDDVGATLCHAWIIHDDGVELAGNLSQLECHNCLRIIRANHRRRIRAVDRRLAGKDSLQLDAFT